MNRSSTVLAPAQQMQVAQALEEDAQIMNNKQLVAQLSGQPAEVQNEILRIITVARNIALQVALLVPLIAVILG